MKNLACRLLLAAGVIAGLLTATIGPARPAHAAPAEGPVQIDLDLPLLVCGIGISLLGDATAACPGAVPSGGTHAPAIPTLAGADEAAAPDDLVAADAAGQVTVCGIALAVAGDALGDCPPSLGGPAAPGDLAASEAAVAEYLVDLDVDLGLTVCGIAVALLGDATGACPAAPSPGAPALVLDIPGVGTLDLAAPLTVCGIAVAVVEDATGACPG